MISNNIEYIYIYNSNHINVPLELHRGTVAERVFLWELVNSFVWSFSSFGVRPELQVNADIAKGIVEACAKFCRGCPVAKRLKSTVRTLAVGGWHESRRFSRPL